MKRNWFFPTVGYRLVCYSGWVTTLSSLLLDLVFPPQCCHCHRVGSFLCSDCYEQLEFFTFPIALDLTPLYLDQLWSSCHYQSPLSEVIRAFKYQRVKGIGRLCGRMMYYTTFFPNADVITYVPLHPKRQRDRGFNQAEEIAQEVSRLAQLPCVPLLTRTVHTQAQATLTDRTQRLTHLQNHFAVATNALDLTNRSVLLVDDVATTGTTLNECAKVLKAHGAKHVYGLTIAHGN